MPLDPPAPGTENRELMICTACHHPNDPETKYCASCGAPLGPTSAWGPWEQVLAQGFALRQATTAERPKLILVLGIWVMFFPVWIASPFLMWLMLKRVQDKIVTFLDFSSFFA